MNEEIIRIIVLSSISSWGVTQAVKPNIKKIAPESFTRTAIRLAAIALGALMGFAMKSDATGLAAGASGAALSAVIVAAIKQKISK